MLIVAGTPETMGAAHGTLLQEPMKKLVDKVLYLVAGADSMSSGTWAFDRFEEIERRTSPYIPERFLIECDAMSRAAGVSQRDGRYANLFPERFHCSGVAVRGKPHELSLIAADAVFIQHAEINNGRERPVCAEGPARPFKASKRPSMQYALTVTAVSV